VRPLLPLLQKLSDSGNARIMVVGAGAKAESDRFPGLDLRDWSEENEIRYIQEMDIGIMPVRENLWARGKSGYKLIQYMACGLPVVASPIGVNCEIVESDVNGFLARSDDEWERALTGLIDDAMLRNRLGEAARERAVERYSLAVHGPRLTALLSGLSR
jgi:glycosyltransferase involved in cell wall biosynthesis